jgi:large subunit ribosomal protein L3
MIPALLGRKIGMTQVFLEDGSSVPVTVLQAGPCTVMLVRDQARDGYSGVQLGFGDVKPQHMTLPQIGHAARAGTTPKRVQREVRLEAPAACALGDVITVGIFKEQGVRFVDVIGISKGKGFAGVMKRHGFGGQPGSHGTERKHRSPGSIGSHCANRGAGPIKRGKRMAGHMGHERVTVKSQRLVAVDEERNILLIKGAVPGPNGSVVLVKKAKTRT